VLGSGFQREFPLACVFAKFDRSVSTMPASYGPRGPFTQRIATMRRLIPGGDAITVVSAPLQRTAPLGVECCTGPPAHGFQRGGFAAQWLPVVAALSTEACRSCRLRNGMYYEKNRAAAAVFSVSVSIVRAAAVPCMPAASWKIHIEYGMPGNGGDPV